MKLAVLLEKLEYEILQGSVDCEISSLVYDSRKATPGCVFVCISGFLTDAHKYIPDVTAKGAAAVIVTKDLAVDGQVSVIKVKDDRLALAMMSAAYFGYPSDKLFTIGLTGTKGKTTTTYMVYKALNLAGIKCGLIGTIETIIGEEHIPSSHSTPESYVIQETFAKMVDKGIKAVVMEVSSQGLKTKRVAGINFDIGVFTNLEPDHIGGNEHPDFADYLYCKSLLFRQCSLGLGNVDDEHFAEIMKDHSCKLLGFGCSEKADFRAENISFTKAGIKYECELNTDIQKKLADLRENVFGAKLSGMLNEGENCSAESKKTENAKESFEAAVHSRCEVFVDIPGRFTVYNSLTAFAICRILGINENTVLKALSEVKVKGRVETIPVSDDFTIMVDYAHNEMSLRSVLTTLREYKPERLVCIFGCGGNRSKERRYTMGKVSGELADFTIVTSDNPRFEKPEDIIADIVSSIEKVEGAEYKVVCDRYEAIKYAVSNAQKGDLILVAGKGHEDYQEIEGVKYHMDDAELIRRAAAEIKAI